VCVNGSYSYTYSTDISNPTITWSVVSGSITLTSGQGTSTATFQFGAGFTSGSIQALGSNQEVCSESISMAAIPAPVTLTGISGPG
jgi:hypothetical protein